MQWPSTGWIQSCTPPAVEAKTKMRGEAGKQMNVPITTGKMSVEDLVLNNVKPANEADTWAWDLLMRAIDNPVRDVIFKFTMVEYDQNGTDGRVIERTHYEGFVDRVEPGERSAEQEEDSVVEVVRIKITAPPTKT